MRRGGRALLVLLAMTVTALAGCTEDGGGGLDEAGKGGEVDLPDDVGNVTAGNGADNATVEPVLVDALLSFTVDKVEGTVPLTVNFAFNAEPSDNRTTWSLDFGDGSEPATGDWITLPGDASHTYAVEGTYAPVFTAVFNGTQEETKFLNITVGPPPPPPPEAHFEFGLSAGCVGDVLQLAGANCVSATQGPAEDPVDGFWLALDERYWGFTFTTTAGNVQGDSDCFFADAEFAVTGSANNGGGPCEGAVPEGTAWLFLYSYAEPSTGQTVDFDFGNWPNP